MQHEDKFNPIRLSVTSSEVGAGGSDGNAIAIVAEDDAGRYVGITAPQELASLLEEFFPTSGQRFLEFWATYEAERGGHCFFLDLRRMADAIVAAPELPALRKLSGAKTANDFMHNAYQAHVMMLAHRQYPGGVTLLRASAGQKSPDFIVATGSVEIPCEIKTITRPNGLDLFDYGCRLPATDRNTFIRTLGGKIDEALAQTDRDGLVIIAVWCDSLGMILGRTLEDWECTPETMFTVGHVIITCRDQEGRDRWFGFPVDEARERVREIDARLVRILPPPFSIPFASSAISISNSTRWMSIGRAVRLASRGTPVDYTDEELAEYRRERPFRNVPLGRLLLWKARWSLVEQQIDAFGLSAGQMEKKPYKLDEFLRQPAGLALYLWLACLHAAIHQAFEPDGSAPPPVDRGVVNEDYRLIENAIGQIGAAFWLAPDVVHVGVLVGQLTTDRKVFSAVRRVTSGYGKLLTEELALRQAQGDLGGMNDGASGARPESDEHR